MFKLSYASEIPFKKKAFLDHLEVSHFCDSWHMFLVCVLLKYLLILDHFHLQAFLPHTRNPSLHKVTYNSIRYPMQGICQYLIQSGHWLLSNAALPVLPQGTSFGHSSLSSENSSCLLGHLFRVQPTFCLISLLIFTYPDSTQPSGFRQMQLLSGSQPCFLYPQSSWCFFLYHQLHNLWTAIIYIIVLYCLRLYTLSFLLDCEFLEWKGWVL